MKPSNQIIDRRWLCAGYLILLAIFFHSFMFWVSAAGTDIFIAQGSSGGNTGADCADARGVGSLTSGDWVPGNTIHICPAGLTPAVNGTGLRVLGDGTSGSHITIFFEPGGNITSPAMALGIDWNAHSFIDVTGGPEIGGALNGIIQNTANGSALANQVGAAKCIGSGSIGTNDTITLVNCHNMFVTVVTDSSGQDNVLGLAVGSNGSITHCSFDHGDLGLAAGNASNVVISFNHTTFTNHGITVGTSSQTPVNNISIHDNDIDGGGNIYDGAPGAYHRDPIIIICETGTPKVDPCVTGLLIYNNFFHGVWSTESTSGTTADTFLDDYFNSEIEAFVFNNVSSHAATDTGTNNAFFENGHAGMMFNNTVAPAVSGMGGNCVLFGNGSTHSPSASYNEICRNVKESMEMNCNINTGGTIDYNDYFGGIQWYANPTAPACSPNGIYSTLALWKTSCASNGVLGCDAHTIQTDPLLNSDFTLQATSPAVGAGLNLTSTVCGTVPQACIGAPQTFGINGACGTGCLARATGSTPWDLGAYPFSGSTAPSDTFVPGNLAFGNQTVGTSSASQTIVLTNTGTANLTVSSVVASSDYSVTTSPATACGTTLTPTSSCNIIVVFSPTITGPDNGTITVTDNASGSPHVLPLTGTGVSPSSISLVNVTNCPSQLLSGTCTITPVSGGNSVVMGITFNNGSGACVVSGITGLGGTWAQASGARSTNATPNSAADIWSAPTVTNGLSVVTITTTPSTGCSADEVFWEVNGVNTVDVAAAANNTAASATPSGAAVTTTHNSEFLVGVLNFQGSITGINSGNIFTNDSTLQGNGWAHYIQTATGTRTPQWTGSSGTSNGSTAAFFLGSGGGGTSVAAPSGVTVVAH